MADVFRLTATQAIHGFHAGTLTPADYVAACLERILAREDEVHAFAHFDPAAFRAAVNGARPGKLQGLPVGIKDVLDTADAPTEYGSAIWAGHRPRADAACVALTRTAGGLVAGKTVTTEFATRRPGPTANPANLAHTPGGSSSGSAAAVADGFVPLAFGTQTAGSIIRPAAFCGVVGYKPTFGTIPRLGMKVMSESLDTIGVMARSVADCALFVAALTGLDLGDPDQKPESPPRIGICQTHAWPKASEETIRLLDNAMQSFARSGAHVELRDLPPEFADLEQAHPVVMGAESALSMAWERACHADALSADLRERMDAGEAFGAAALVNAKNTFERLQRAFPAAMEGLDILVTPSAPGEAPEGLGWTGDPSFNSIWTALHVPCVTVPAGGGRNGLPLGVQIVARRGEDRAALAWAAWVAAALA
jgi:amidase